MSDYDRHGRSLGGIARLASRAPVHLFHRHLGWLLGHRFLLLAHIGRRTGNRHEVVLEVVRREPARRAYVVVAGFGEKADWLRNVEANGHAEISVARTRFVAVARRLGDAEAAGVLAGYERAHRVFRPIVRALLGRLLGWRYDGSSESRQRAVRRLPFVEFSPVAIQGEQTVSQRRR